MPRGYKRKSETPHVSEDILELAITDVQNGKSLREAAKSAGVSKSALHRFLKKRQLDPDAKLQPNYQHPMIFTVAQEKALSAYLKNCSEMFNGLTTTQVRALAFEMAQANKIKCPVNWVERKMAGRDWLTGFLERNPELSVRKPEATSLARSSAFNKYNIDIFGHMNAYYNAAVKSWILSNPGQSITIDTVASLIRQAWETSSIPTNTTSGFHVTGIGPCDKHVYGDGIFLPPAVTEIDKPRVVQGSCNEDSCKNSNTGNTVLDLSTSAKQNELTDGNYTTFSPQIVRGDPKASSRKMVRTGHKKGLPAKSQPEIIRIREQVETKKKF